MEIFDIVLITTYYLRPEVQADKGNYTQFPCLFAPIETQYAFNEKSEKSRPSSKTVASSSKKSRPKNSRKSSKTLTSSSKP